MFTIKPQTIWLRGDVKVMFRRNSGGNGRCVMEITDGSVCQKVVFVHGGEVQRIDTLLGAPLPATA